MTATVLLFTGSTKLDYSAERILTGALEADLDDAIVIGHHKDGSFFFASTTADVGAVLWLLEVAKKRLLEMGGA